MRVIIGVIYCFIDMIVVFKNLFNFVLVLLFLLLFSKTLQSLA
jgi:type II restriction/modification system DNA methylase subunit YeeA